LKSKGQLLPLFLGNAGTAMRPLTAALSLLGGEFELSGVPRMHERPIGDLVDALTQLGCRIDYLGNPGYPAAAHPPGRSRRAGARCADPRARRRVEPVPDRAAAGAAAGARNDIVIEVVGELISKPYIEITLNLLARFGIAVQRDGWERFTIPAGSRYSSPGDIHVEADASSASYFIALGAIATGTSGKPERHPDRRRGRRFDPGRHPLHRRRPADGRRRSTAARTGSKCAAAPGRSRPSTSTPTTFPTPR
jgi:3-phosphoshikimate 1-carboxyvinyltransferase